MESLNADALGGWFAPFLNSRDLVALTQVSKVIRGKSDQLLLSKAREIFGKINAEEQLDKPTIARLLYCTEKLPAPAVNHNTYQAPTSTLDRWNWLNGVENALDKEVRESYNKAIHFLQNRQATSVTQLKNQMTAFWHINREVQDYERFKGGEMKASRLRQFSQPSPPIPIQSVMTRWPHTFAKIGRFTLNEDEFEVVAFCRIFHEDSIYDGQTYIGIFKKQLSYTFSKDNHHLLVTRGSGDMGIEHHGPESRLLEQKLTQIIVEMLMQNKHIKASVMGYLQDAPVLSCGCPVKITDKFVMGKTIKEILQRPPILNPGAAILPEHWGQGSPCVEQFL